MWWFTIGKQKLKIPVSAYFKALGELLIHMFTQKRTLGCDDNQLRWFEHLILVLGYLLLLFTTVFLDWFSTQNIFIIVIGYIESAVIFVVTFDFVRRRIEKQTEISKHSHPSDWFFVIWLFLMGLTAFAVRVFIDMDIIENNIWLFLVHLIILVQWALIENPTGNLKKLTQVYTDTTD
ncbi:MAG: hypothetical protein B6D64_06660 [Bacteroidetes bacterium 4484_276]|nr:MAG: hypothetical protein B6D64_06660 [Bacteroidetes bacterium 4484_276]